MQHRWVNAPAVSWRRAGDDTFDAGNLGHQHGHERRRQHRHPAGGNVSPHARDRNLALAEVHAGKRLDVEVDQRRALSFREARIWVWANAIAALRSSVSEALAASTSASVTSKLSGSQRSRSRE